MAFAITNLTEFAPDAIGQSARVTLADQTADTAAQDMGVANLKWLKIRIVAKSGIANTETFSYVLRVDTVVGMTSPELIYVSPTYTAITGDAKVTMEGYGFSEDGFQFVNLDVTNAGTWTFDVELCAW